MPGESGAFVDLRRVVEPVETVEDLVLSEERRQLPVHATVATRRVHAEERQRPGRRVARRVPACALGQRPYDAARDRGGDLGGGGAGGQAEQAAQRLRLADLRPARPRVPFYSTVLDDPRRVPSFDAGYWAANLRNPVRLVDAVQAAAEDGHRTFVEISAHPLLTHALTETVEDALVVPTLRRPAEGERADDTITFHTRLAALRLGGLPVRLPTGGRIVDLPSPPWRHQRHWARTGRPQAASSHPLLGSHVRLPGTRERHAWTANGAGFGDDGRAGEHRPASRGRPGLHRACRRPVRTAWL
ncbi:acyltransferase domain-containing protein [Actinoallomurus spadix]|uniref:Malonyl-CoA:ACP transacylase (MAT) domain-containing protein n=1 Tax=Actinoallomurus spadix TaxID=79912 RepID=A0ABN0WXZ6_9ACTN|nr:acyltransferase domain-containing protein [Actinoallomurus spadix]MCO5989615.1 acyltransferase domain-containing protein [Actinoallomurus spadix]